MPRLRLAGLLILALSASVGSAEEPSGAVVGEVKLPSKITAHYEYHFGQNSLQDFRMAGEHIVALTESGELVHFDAKTRKPIGSPWNADRIRCLGDDGKDVLAGFEDGRICRVDPATWELKEVTKLEGVPRWLKMQPGGLLAVVERKVDLNYEGKIYPQIQSFVYDAASKRTLPVGYQASAFLRDRKGRLWLGDDRGEWGGKVSKYDPKLGMIQTIDPPKQPKPPFWPADQPYRSFWAGIYGFVELQEDQIWAYGGTMHMVSGSFIARIDTDKAEELASFSNGDEFEAAMNGRKMTRPTHPTHPFTQILQQPDGRLLAFSYDSIYRADARLVKWERVVDLKLNYRPGRPDSMGVYPAIKTVRPLPGPGDQLLCATILDGLVRYSDGKLFYESNPGALEAARIHHIQASTAGLFFWETNQEDDSESVPWRYQAGTFQQMSFVPPFLRHPDEIKEIEAEEKEQAELERKEDEENLIAPEDQFPNNNTPDQPLTQWNTTRVLIAHDGKITSVSASEREPGTRTTVRWNGNKPEILGSEISSINPAECFMTPDGSLWNVNEALLHKFVDGRWVVLMKSPGLDGEDIGDLEGSKPSRVYDFGKRLRVINRQGPPWILFDESQHRLLSFNIAPDDTRPSFRSLPVGVVNDAILWKDREYLLATSRGLKSYDLASHTLKPSTRTQPPATPTAICKDGLGRVWMIADGLWMSSPGENVAHSFKPLPMIGRSTVTAIAADPEHPDGIAAALEDGGVVFVRASRTP